jgi:alpha-L-fucosidase
MLGAIGASALAPAAHAAVDPNWSSLTSSYKVPDWFRDAKFGIWAHWSAQCVPEQGDWYGRLMYVQSHPHYAHHLKTYGHPADTGFMEIENRWKAENWDPAHLIRLYKAAGAKYFMALACHHDNLDTYDSAHHAWNTTRVGPKRDIIGTWEKLVRAEGLRFGVSNHASHAWHWWGTAYGYDAEGPRTGERYDAFKLRKEDGAGKWWDGLDPQQLYNRAFVPPDGIRSIASMDAWHEVHDGRWMDFAPADNPGFVAKWLARQKDLVEKYKPDIVYFDGYGVPFGTTGLEAIAHYYNQAIQWHGSPDVVVTSKQLNDYQQQGLVDDVERGFSDRLRERPWQTCTCIGDWHYNRARYLDKSYVPAEQVIQRLCDVVSKNGNLLLSIPVRGDGTIDSEEEKIVAGITDWMKIYGDVAIHGSRPYRVYGEGPTQVGGGMFGEGKVKFVGGDVRYMVKDGALYAALLAIPDGKITLKALPRDAVVERVQPLIAHQLPFRQTAEGLEITLTIAGKWGVVPILRIDGKGLL